MTKGIIIVDLEATCEAKSINDKYPMEIIEIGAVKVVDGQIVDTFSTFVKPTLTDSLTKFCTKLTTITWENLQDAPHFADALRSFLEWAEGYPLASWGWYDAKQFSRDCALHGLSKRFLEGHRSIKHEYIDNIRPKSRYRGSYFLPSILEYHRLDFEGTHHRGIDDALAVAKLYLHLYDEFEVEKSID